MVISALLMADRSNATHSCSCRRRRSSPVVLLRDVPIGVIRQEGRGSNADDCAEQDIERDYITRAEGREQRRRDQRRWSTGDDRGEVKTERGAAVTQPRGEAFRDQCRL